MPSTANTSCREGNYNSTNDNLAGLTLRNVAFQGKQVGNKNNGTYCELIAAINLLFSLIMVGSEFRGTNGLHRRIHFQPVVGW